MSIAKHVAACAIASGALFAADSAFTPGTAEAHCGQHANTCSGGEYSVGSWCNGGHLLFIMNVYAGFCGTPQAGCSGAGCANWPCASGTCNHGPNQCYLYNYDWDSGQSCGS